MIGKWSLLAALCVGLGLAERVNAQDAVWVMPQSLSGSARPALRAGLEAEGVLVREASPADEACDASACAVGIAKNLNMRFAVLARVEAGGDANIRSIDITLVGTDGRSGPASVEVQRGDLQAAVRAAYRQAELALELGAEGLLRVRVKPQSALVTIDTEPVGLAPIERKLSAGKHEVALALDGFAAAKRQVDVARGRVSELDVRLVRVLNVSTSKTERAPSPLNWIVGGALVAGAVPALVISIATLATDGHCHARDPAGACVERVHFGARDAALLGFGAAALVGGGFVLFAAPFTIEARAETRGARAAVTARF